MRKNDLLGLPFGRWLVIAPASSNRTGQARWVCRCDCGIERIVSGTALAHGKTKSCGCLSRELTRSRMRTTNSTRTHGHTTTRNKRGFRQGSPTYTSWRGMKDRCLKASHHAWGDYGGRGIRVCDRWIHSFENFLADMGERPEGMSLDRIDPNGSYEPQNCRWATHIEQRNNHRLSARRVAEVLDRYDAEAPDLIERLRRELFG